MHALPIHQHAVLLRPSLLRSLFLPLIGARCRKDTPMYERAQPGPFQVAPTAWLGSLSRLFASDPQVDPIMYLYLTASSSCMSQVPDSMLDAETMQTAATDCNP
jgi:hypothetical protein